MNIIGHRKLYYSISGVVIIASLAALLLWGFRLGIDFTGGSSWQVKAQHMDIKTISALFAQQGIPYVSAEPLGTDELMLRFEEVPEVKHQQLLTALRGAYPDVIEEQFAVIGPAISDELRSKAMTAILFVLFGISLYIAFAFREVSRPLSSWVYGFVTLFTLFHDAIVPAGVFSFLGHFKHVEIDSNFVVAMLVVMGFSVHDTIVVFDRVRENLRRVTEKISFEELVNRSMVETFARSVNTSLTVLLVLLSLFIFGEPNLRYFILTLLIGITTGTYSSIFIASPILVDIAYSKAKKK
ncbi:MAG: protein translocase subunit SecF [Patescibacteria group bacterium]|nr:protein translocase subunit SecF [Patescibacteria group bacterium]MDE2438309.1 protein translocase subunit SecF [Patescibacteria group bacterium]